MKEQISNKIKEEYKDLRSELTDVEKEIEAIGRSKKENRLGTSLLFGVFPSLLVAFILSRFYTGGLIDASLLTILSTLSTVTISGVSQKLFEKKWNYKQELKEFNVPASIKDKLEREIELEQLKKQLEVKINILKDYYERINDNNFEFVNSGYNADEVDEELESNIERVEAVANRQYIYDKFADFRDGKRNTFSGVAKGALLGLLLSLVVMYLPQIMAGISVASIVTTPLTTALSIMTAGAFATYNGIRNHTLNKIFKKKNKELGSLEIPSGREPLYLENYRLVGDAVKAYEESLIKKDSLALPVQQKSIDVVETEKINSQQPIKEEIVKLEKKL